MSSLVISAHYDDAVMSVGAWIADHPGTVVATVFSADPPDHVTLTDWDRTCGFESSAEAVWARDEENRAAARALGFSTVDLGFTDWQYREPRAAMPGAIAREINRIVWDLGPETILFPIGIEHPDHLAAAEARRWLDPLPPGGSGSVPLVGVYLDLPYGHVHPYHAEGRRAGEPTADAAARKAEAVACYASQIRAVTRMGSVGAADEKVWWLT